MSRYRRPTAAGSTCSPRRATTARRERFSRCSSATAISAARDGLRWHLIESTPGRYDWSSVCRCCGRRGVRVSGHLGPVSLRVARRARHLVARLRRRGSPGSRPRRRASSTEETDLPPIFCTVNEISFWAWAGGETGRFAPAAQGRGDELKRQLVRAAIAATAAVRAAVPEARFIHAEPAIHVDPGLPTPTRRRRPSASAVAI